MMAARPLTLAHLSSAVGLLMWTNRSLWLWHGREENWLREFFPDWRRLAVDVLFLRVAPRTHKPGRREGCAGARTLRQGWSVGLDQKLPSEFGARPNAQPRLRQAAVAQGLASEVCHGYAQSNGRKRRKAPVPVGSSKFTCARFAGLSQAQTLAPCTEGRRKTGAGE